MRWQIIVAGKPALAYAKAGVDEYLQRMRRYLDAELVMVKAGSSREVSQRLLEKSQGSYRIVLDERGERPTTRQLSERIAALEMRGDVKCVAFLIGASDGHTQDLRDNADWILSLSSMTMQHELALVVLLEQIYRVASLRKGEPYHRD